MCSLSDNNELISLLEAKYLQRIEVRCKRGRKVPILLTHEMNKNIELLIKARGSDDVIRSNRYMPGTNL